jgi:hypothetical protein
MEIAYRKGKYFYVIGFGLSVENLDVLKNEIIASDKFNLIEATAKYLYVEIWPDKLAGLGALWDMVEGIDDIVQGKVRNKFYAPEYGNNVWLGIATLIYTFFTLRLPGRPSRGVIIDYIDRMVLRGYSLNAKKALIQGINNLWREHAVPIDYQITLAFEMFKNGATLGEVAKMFEMTTAVVYITKEEQQILDVVKKLKTTMPPGWKLGDDLFARFHYAGILLEDNVKNVI